MKLFRIFLGFWLLIGLFFAVSLFFPREFRVEKSIEISKPVNEVFNYLSQIENIAALSPWNKQTDSTMNSFYSKNKQGLNATYYFSGNLLDKGYLKISELDSLKSITMLLNINNGAMTSNTSFHFEAIDENTTKLTWKDYKDVGYNPLYRYMIPSKIKETEAAFEMGLLRIKTQINAKSN